MSQTPGTGRRSNGIPSYLEEWARRYPRAQAKIERHRLRTKAAKHRANTSSAKAA